jgi:hypothetical protein
MSCDSSLNRFREVIGLPMICLRRRAVL